MGFIAVFLFVLLCLIVGWFALCGLGAASLEPIEGTVAAFVLGMGVLGWAGFTLAEFGAFSSWVLLLIALFMSGALFLSTGTIPSLAFTTRWVYGLLLVWLIGAGWLFLRPHQILLGAADAGVYLNLASHIAGSGRILIVGDPALAANPDGAALFLRDLGPTSVAPAYLMPGFYVFDPSADPIYPQFYHLFPVLQAIPMTLLPQTEAAGAQAGLLLNGVLALFASLCVMLTVRQIAGWRAALLALAGLSANALQIWFARYPTTEPLSQLLLWSALWGTGSWLSERPYPRLWAALGGTGFGLFFLTRIDAVLILPVLVALALWVWLFEPELEEKHTFFIAAGGLLIHSLLHGYFQSRHYFLDLYGLGFAILVQTPWLVAAAFAVGILVLVLLYANRGRIEKLRRFRRQMAGLVVVLFAAFVLFNGAIRPFVTETVVWTDPFSTGQIPVLDHENLLRLGWYLSPIGVWLGAAGVCLMIWRARRETAVLLAVTLIFSIVYIWNIRANPHQIYAMRRYVPAVMPFFVVGGAVLIEQVWRIKGAWQPPFAALIAVSWLAGFGWSARGFVTQIDYANLPPQLDALDALFEPDSVLLFNDQTPIGQGDILGTPLRFIYGQKTYTLRRVDSETMALLQPLLERWQQDGSAVYFIHVPTNQTDYLPAEMTYLDSFLVESSRLEFSYERKPNRLVTQRWAGDVYRLERAAP